jgi:methionine synthase II (cobalamin-independent)
LKFIARYQKSKFNTTGLNKGVSILENPFLPRGLPALIGSLPLTDHVEACELVLEHTPQIPLWVQLPAHKEEAMVPQFMPGLPGICSTGDRVYMNTDQDDFDNDILKFYEDYIAVVEGHTDLSQSRFVLSEDTARGFFVFIERLKRLSTPPVAVKGQVTGPFTFCTGISDQNKKAIIYDEQVKDAAVKLLALKSRWQVQQLSRFGCTVIIFFDEPALSGFGSSEFISISRDGIIQSLEEVIAAVHAEGGLAGVHVCANTDWSLVLDSAADIVSFDAYSYFDRFILYSDQIKAFLDSGKIVAWGMVPTLQADELENATAESLFNQWQQKAAQVEKLGIDSDQLIAQSLITPSCGAGSLSPGLAIKALRLTQEVSEQIRQTIA